MIFLKGVRILLTKEMKDHFTSPLTYILTAIFSALMGWIFFNYLVAAKNVTAASLGNSILLPTFGVINSIFMFLIPIITMRSFSEEEKLKTLDLLLLSKLTSTQIVFSKFISIFMIALFMLSFTLFFPLILSFSGFDDYGLLFSGYLGTVLTTMCYISVALFTSGLTENQFVSVFSAFSIILGLMLLSLTSNVVSNFIVAKLLGFLSIATHFQSFSRGAVISFDLFYLLSFTFFFLYLSFASLEVKKW